LIENIVRVVYNCFDGGFEVSLPSLVQLGAQVRNLGAQLRTFSRRKSFGRTLPLALFETAGEFLLSPVGLLAPAALQRLRVGWA